jgi:hypothetical protein
MVEGLTHTVGVGEGKENVAAAVVVYSRGEVKAPSPVWSWRGEGKRCGSGSGVQQGRGNSPESRVLPMTPELTTRHGQQQVNQGDEWSERQSRRE